MEGVKIKNNWNHHLVMFLFVSPFLVLLTIYCEISDLENSRNAIKAATKWAAVLGLGSLHVMSAPTCDGWKWHVHHIFAFWNYNCCQVKSDSTIRVKFCINNSFCKNGMNVIPQDSPITTGWWCGESDLFGLSNCWMPLPLLPLPF